MRIRLDCAAVRIEAVAIYPVGLSLPPLLAQPLGQLGQRVRVAGGGGILIRRLGVGLPPRPPPT
jgi:hypothetical protein